MASSASLRKPPPCITTSFPAADHGHPGKKDGNARGGEDRAARHEAAPSAGYKPTYNESTRARSDNRLRVAEKASTGKPGSTARARFQCPCSRSWPTLEPTTPARRVTTRPDSSHAPWLLTILRQYRHSVPGLDHDDSGPGNVRAALLLCASFWLGGTSTNCPRPGNPLARIGDEPRRRAQPTGARCGFGRPATPRRRQRASVCPDHAAR